jgi:tripartite-type tricarboxylate transporter receptor subunit TctC
MSSTPEEFGAPVKSEMTRLGTVIRDTGLRET